MGNKATYVYLAGAMSGLSADDAKGWRIEAGKRLTEAGFTVLDPARGLMFLEPNETVADGYDDRFDETRHTVFNRDKFDSTRSDILLVNLLGHPRRVSIGTVMEMAWAHLSGRFTVTVMDKEDTCYLHAFINETSSVIIESLDEAVDYIIRTFGGK